MQSPVFSDVFHDEFERLTRLREEGNFEVAEIEEPRELVIPSFNRADYFEGTDRAGKLIDVVLYMNFIRKDDDRGECFKQELLQNGDRLGFLHVALMPLTDRTDAYSPYKCFNGVTQWLVSIKDGLVDTSVYAAYLDERLKLLLDDDLDDFDLIVEERDNVAYAYDLSTKQLTLYLPISYNGQNCIPEPWKGMRLDGSKDAFREVLNSSGEYWSLEDKIAFCNALFPNNQIDVLLKAIEEDPDRFAEMTPEQLWLIAFNPRPIFPHGMKERFAALSESDVNSVQAVDWNQFAEVREGLKRHLELVLADTGEIEVTDLHPLPSKLKGRLEGVKKKIDDFDKSPWYEKLLKKLFNENPNMVIKKLSEDSDPLIVALHKMMMRTERTTAVADIVEKTALGRTDQVIFTDALRAYEYASRVCFPFDIADAERAIGLRKHGVTFVPDFVRREELVTVGFENPGVGGTAKILEAVSDLKQRQLAIAEVDQVGK